MLHGICSAVDTSSGCAHDLIRACAVLTNDCGVELDANDGMDYAVLDAITASSYTEEKDEDLHAIEQSYELLLHSLPVAAALTFVTPQRWDHTSFLYAMEAFQGNEHCAVYALSKLLQVYAYKICVIKQRISLLNTNISVITTTGTTGANVKAPPLLTISDAATVGLQSGTLIPNSVNYIQLFQQESELYLQLGVAILLDIRGSSGYEWQSLPVRSMIFILELYVRHNFPHLHASSLEKYLPYTIMHNSYADIAMGKHKVTDKLQSGMVLDKGLLNEHTIVNREAALAVL